MLSSGKSETIVLHRVFRKGVEPVVRSLDIVEENSAVLVLQDRLELLLGWLLLNALDGEILFARDVALVPSLIDPIDIVALALAPTLFFGRIPDLVPPAAPTPALGPVAYSAMFGTTEAVEFLQSVGRNAGMKHSAVPDVLRPLRRL